MRISLIVENKGIKLRVGNPFSNLFEKKKKLLQEGISPNSLPWFF